LGGEGTREIEPIWWEHWGVVLREKVDAPSGCSIVPGMFLSNRSTQVKARKLEEQKFEWGFLGSNRCKSLYQRGDLPRGPHRVRTEGGPVGDKTLSK